MSAFWAFADKNAPKAVFAVMPHWKVISIAAFLHVRRSVLDNVLDGIKFRISTHAFALDAC